MNGVGEFQIFYFRLSRTYRQFGNNGKYVSIIARTAIEKSSKNQAANGLQDTARLTFQSKAAGLMIEGQVMFDTINVGWVSKPDFFHSPAAFRIFGAHQVTSVTVRMCSAIRLPFRA
jgi:hypothetical protein